MDSWIELIGLLGHIQTGLCLLGVALLIGDEILRPDHYRLSDRERWGKGL